MKYPRAQWRISILAAAVFAGTLHSSKAEDWEKSSGLWTQSVVLEQKANYEGSLAIMGEFAREGHDNYLAMLRSGWLSYEAKQYKKSIQYYDAAARAMPTSVTPLLGLATSYRADGDTASTEKTYEQVLMRDPGNYTAALALGSYWYLKNDFYKAAQYYALVQKQYPEDTTSLSGLGWSLIYLNKKRDAQPLFQRLLILSPTYLQAKQGYDISGGKQAVATRP
ncbi:MAG: tetratricopeptide repeat protein [Chthoniobacterales bacterium]